MSGIEAAAIDPVRDAIKAPSVCCARTDYFEELKVNLETLKDEIHRQKELKVHVETRVKHEKKPQMQQMHKVADWLYRVNRLRENIKEIIKEAEEEIHKKSSEMVLSQELLLLQQGWKESKRKAQPRSEMIKDGNFDVVVEPGPGDLLLNEMPVQKLWGCNRRLQKSVDGLKIQVWKILAYMVWGGVEKTTLLKKIYNKAFRRECVVIWVEMSRQGPVKTVQKVICKKIEISEEEWKNRSDETDREAIWKLQRRQKFVSMFDNAEEQWDYFYLDEEVGIP